MVSEKQRSHKIASLTFSYRSTLQATALKMMHYRVPILCYYLRLFIASDAIFSGFDVMVYKCKN